MLGTYAFYVASTVKNRVLARVRRLKQPRYLVGLFVGLAYLIVVFSRSGPRPVTVDGQAVPIDPATGAALFTLIVAVVMLLSWALPDSEAGLDLTETEALFLFPAPITRAQLLGFVLARGLFPLLITAVILRILFLRGASFVGAVTEPLNILCFMQLCSAKCARRPARSQPHLLTEMQPCRSTGSRHRHPYASLRSRNISALPSRRSRWT